jgi:hypothetical protein
MEGAWLFIFGCGTFSLMMSLPILALERGWIARQPIASIPRLELEAPMPNLQPIGAVFGTLLIRDTGYAAIFMQIENQLFGNKAPGLARNVKGHLTYLTADKRVIAKVCPAHWSGRRDSIVDIPPGEILKLAIAFDGSNGMVTEWHTGGVSLTGCSFLEIRLLSGEELLGQFNFKFPGGKKIRNVLDEHLLRSD